MKKFALLFLVFSTLIFGQKKKNFTDVNSNIDAKILVMKPLGNNTFAKDLEVFYGFGFGGNLMTPINFGIGLDYNILFSNVKPEGKSRYGEIGSPKLTMVDLYLTHRENISEEFLVEETGGFSYYNFANSFINKSEKYKTTGSGFNLGAKAIYILDGSQQVLAGAKVNFYYGNVYNENPEIEKYYNKSIFLNVSLGYRYQF